VTIAAVPAVLAMRERRPGDDPRQQRRDQRLLSPPAAFARGPPRGWEPPPWRFAHGWPGHVGSAAGP